MWSSSVQWPLCQAPLGFQLHWRGDQRRAEPVYFNPNAFITPLAGTYGNVGRDVLEGPSLATLDVSFAKKIVLSERLSLQFRSEFFNLFNRTNFNTPNPVVFTSGPTTPSPIPVVAVPSSTAGVIIAVSTSSRRLQFGLKLLW